jgi:molecular chaperone HscA
MGLAVVLVIVYNQVDWRGLTEDLGAGGLVGGPAGGPELVPVHDQQLASTGTSAVTAGDGIAILAEVTTGFTTVYAVDAEGSSLWINEYELEPTELNLMVVGDLLVLDALYSATDEGRTMRAAVKLDTGELLWKQPWEYRNDVAFYGTEVVVDQHDGLDDNAAVRIDLATGEEVWRERGPENLGSFDDYRVRAASVWNEGEGAGEVPANSYSLYDNLVATEQIVDLNPEEGTAVVRDAASGDETFDGVLPIDDDLWTVFDGLVIGRASDEVSPGRDTLVAYSLTDFSVVWSLPLDAPVSIQQVKACGPHLVCAAVDHSESYEQYRTFAVSTDSGEEQWDVKVDWAVEDGWYASADGLVHGDQPFDTVSDMKVLDFEGKTLRDAEDATVMAFREGRAVLETVASGFSGVSLQVSVLDMATGEETAAVDVGDGVPEHAALAGDLLVVLTADFEAMVFTIPDLA